MGHRPRTQPPSIPADTHYPTSPPRRLKNPNQYLDIEYKAAGLQIRRPDADTLDESAELARQVSQDARAQPPPQSSKYDPYPRVTFSEISAPKGILKSHELSEDERSGNKKPRLAVGWSEHLSEEIGPSWWRKNRSRWHTGRMKEPLGDPLTKESSASRGKGSKRKDNPTAHAGPKRYNSSAKEALKISEGVANLGTRQEESKERKATSGTAKYLGHKDDSGITLDDKKQTTPEPGVDHEIEVPEELRRRLMNQGNKSNPPHADSYLKQQRSTSWGQ
jgi:hypothetical protein